MPGTAAEISELVKETEALQTRIQALQVRFRPSRLTWRVSGRVIANSSPPISLQADGRCTRPRSCILVWDRQAVAHWERDERLLGHVLESAILQRA